MGYQISYGQDVVSKTKKREFRMPRPGRGGFMRLGVPGLILLFVVVCFIPQVRLTLRDLLLPGDPEVTATALERLVETVSEGESIQTALTEFCREIIDHGLQAA